MYMNSEIIKQRHTRWSDLLQEIICEQEKSYYIIKHPPSQPTTPKRKYNTDSLHSDLDVIFKMKLSKKPLINEIKAKEDI